MEKVLEVDRRHCSILLRLQDVLILSQDVKDAKF